MHWNHGPCVAISAAGSLGTLNHCSGHWCRCRWTLIEGNNGHLADNRLPRARPNLWPAASSVRRDYAIHPPLGKQSPAARVVPGDDHSATEATRRTVPETSPESSACPKNANVGRVRRQRLVLRLRGALVSRSQTSTLCVSLRTGKRTSSDFVAGQGPWAGINHERFSSYLTHRRARRGLPSMSNPTLRRSESGFNPSQLPIGHLSVSRSPSRRMPPDASLRRRLYFSRHSSPWAKTHRRAQQPADRDRGAEPRDRDGPLVELDSQLVVARGAANRTGKIAELKSDGSLDPNNFTWPGRLCQMSSRSRPTRTIRWPPLGLTRSWCRHCGRT